MMDKCLITIKFFEGGVKTLYAKGKTSTREEFNMAKRLELRRGKSGCFVSKFIKT
tara:strand:- start:74 stop:238 length:165 start_codon:yes stop_codon:yes gene_type:complete